MNILIASSIYPGAIEALRRDHDVVCAFNAAEDELRARIPDRDILIFRSGVDINARVLGSGARLSLLIRAGSGIDNIDLDYVEQRKLPLRRVESPGAKAVAELAFALLLNLARMVRTADSLL